MFGMASIKSFILIFILFSVGCAASYVGQGGVEPTETLTMDGEFERAMTIEKMDILGVDMPTPFKGGCKIVGVSFDPAILFLVHFLRYDVEGLPRVQYMFQPVSDGTTDVLFKMEPLGGGDVEVYKRVTINVGKGD